MRPPASRPPTPDSAGVWRPRAASSERSDSASRLAVSRLARRAKYERRNAPAKQQLCAGRLAAIQISHSAGRPPALSADQPAKSDRARAARAEYARGHRRRRRRHWQPSPGNNNRAARSPRGCHVARTHTTTERAPATRLLGWIDLSDFGRRIPLAASKGIWLSRQSQVSRTVRLFAWPLGRPVARSVAVCAVRSARSAHQRSVWRSGRFFILSSWPNSRARGERAV